MKSKTDISIKQLIGWIGIGMSKYHDWKHYQTSEKPPIEPKPHWLLDWEWDAVARYAKAHRGEGYRRLTYIIHHQLRKQMEEYDVQVVVAEALALFPGVHPRIISDNGSQFIAKEFSRFIRFSGLQHVRTSVAYPQSNGKIERFHRTINEECLEIASFLTLADARRQIAQYIHHYNTVRLHGAIGYLTPEDMLLGRRDQRLKERNTKLEKAKKERAEKKKIA